MSKCLADIKIGIATEGDNRKFVVMLNMQDTVIQPARKQLETYQYNMAFKEKETEENVVAGLHAFADYLQGEFDKQTTPKLIGL